MRVSRIRVTASAAGIVAIMVMAVYFPHSTALAGDAEQACILTVQGTGIVEIAPDMAILSIGIETVAETAEEAQRKNAASMTAVVEALSQFSVQRENVRTVGFYMWRLTDYRDGFEFQTGFKVTNSLEVPLMNVGEVGKLLDAVISAGANVVNQVRYAAADTSDSYKLALSRALANARSKAAIIASAEGKDVLRVSKITEKQQYESYYPGEWGAGMSAAPLSPGQLKVNAEVEVTFILSDM
jgi:uncharacterized protein YggE